MNAKAHKAKGAKLHARLVSLVADIAQHTDMATTAKILRRAADFCAQAAGHDSGYETLANELSAEVSKKL